MAVTHPNELKEARAKLLSAVAEAIKPDFEPENPITHARGKLVFEERASPEMKVIAEELASLRTRMEGIETASLINNTPGRWRPVGGTDALIVPASISLRDLIRPQSILGTSSQSLTHPSDATSPDPSATPQKRDATEKSE